MILKTKLPNEPILYAPNYVLEFVVQTDTPDKVIGVVLAQTQRSEEQPIIYISRKFTDPKRSFSSLERECAEFEFSP